MYEASFRPPITATVEANPNETHCRPRKLGVVRSHNAAANTMKQIAESGFIAIRPGNTVLSVSLPIVQPTSAVAAVNAGTSKTRQRICSRGK